MTMEGARPRVPKGSSANLQAVHLCNHTVNSVEGVAALRKEKDCDEESLPEEAATKTRRLWQWILINRWGRNNFAGMSQEVKNEVIGISCTGIRLGGPTTQNLQKHLRIYLDHF